MSLSCYYEFRAPAETPAADLEEFLAGVQRYADSVGLKPTIVLNVPFDTPERQAFSQRLSARFRVQDDRLKGLAMPNPEQVRDHNPNTGECQLIAKHGVILVVTDGGCEITFGFLRYPRQITDIHGRILIETECGDNWVFRDFIDSPDPRFREIVSRFEVAGFLSQANDEFA